MSAGTFFQTVGGQYSQALGMHEIALVCVLALEGHDSLDVAKSYNNIGNVYNRQGKYEEALEYYQKSLDIKIRVVGGDHPDVGVQQVVAHRLHRPAGHAVGDRQRLDRAVEHLQGQALTEVHRRGTDLDRAAAGPLGGLDDVRRELAERYLRDTRITLSHLARELGYAEQSVLTRSCRRWFGRGPAAYRKELQPR